MRSGVHNGPTKQTCLVGALIEEKGCRRVQLDLFPLERERNISGELLFDHVSNNLTIGPITTAVINVIRPRDDKMECIKFDHPLIFLSIISFVPFFSFSFPAIPRY